MNIRRLTLKFTRKQTIFLLVIGLILIGLIAWQATRIYSARLSSSTDGDTVTGDRDGQGSNPGAEQSELDKSPTPATSSDNPTPPAAPAPQPSPQPSAPKPKPQPQPTAPTPTPPPTPTVDSTAPTSPTLSGNGMGNYGGGMGTINLSWTPSSDNVGVAGYIVTKVGFWDAHLPGAGTTYSYQENCWTTNRFIVSAYDSAGNISAPSNEVQISLNTGCPI